MLSLLEDITLITIFYNLFRNLLFRFVRYVYNRLKLFLKLCKNKVQRLSLVCKIETGISTSQNEQADFRVRNAMNSIGLCS